MKEANVGPYYEALFNDKKLRLALEAFPNLKVRKKKNVCIQLTESVANLLQDERLVSDREALVNVVRKNS